MQAGELDVDQRQALAQTLMQIGGQFLTLPLFRERELGSQLPQLARSSFGDRRALDHPSIQLGVYGS